MSTSCATACHTSENISRPCVRGAVVANRPEATDIEEDEEEDEEGAEEEADEEEEVVAADDDVDVEADDDAVDPEPAALDAESEFVSDDDKRISFRVMESKSASRYSRGKSFPSLIPLVLRMNSSLLIFRKTRSL